MKNIFKSITVLVLVLSVSNLNAQTGEMNFTLSSTSINVSGQNIAISSTITKTGNTLVWTQSADDSVDTTSFTITSKTGNWNQDTSLGSVIYSMIKENKQVNLTLLSQETGITATLTFNTADNKVGNYTFNINTISYQ